ncbi:hypothetical protein ACIF9R_16830 [Streptomyces sp. NPDC086080]|uniref:hypothetical protein n=1 Tax=Streptomyces sp. NPDC086080 TaxID=3365748 RepID=UPI0037D3106A
MEELVDALSVDQESVAVEVTGGVADWAKAVGPLAAPGQSVKPARAEYNGKS